MGVDSAPGKVLHLPRRPPAERRPIAPNGVIAMVIFVIAEVMMFAGFISAFSIVRASAMGAWPPPGQPRLPIEETLINTTALLLSGAVLYGAQRRFRVAAERARRPLGIAMLLGAFFVVFQGVEWVALIGEGLTVTSSTHGAFFYLIVGAHALHAIAALLALGYAYWLLRRDKLSSSVFVTVQLFWYFVVLLWPVLYWRVYL